MEQPIVSILVPVCNTERYLSTCLESVLGQTLRNIEVICLNDGSTDRSGKILQEFAKRDARIRLIEKPNTGYGHTMNMGLDMARGKYVGIVESDDFASAEMFEILYQCAEQYQTDVVKADFYLFTDTEELILSDYAAHVYGKVFVPSEAENHSAFFVHWSVWCGLYRRTFLQENGIRFNETPGASYQDTAFMFKVWACAMRAYVIKKPLLHYRRGDPASSSYAVSKVFCFCDEYAEIERFLEAHPDKKERLHVLAATRKYRDYLMHFDMLASAYQYAFLLRMEKELRRDAAQGCLRPEGFLPGQWDALQLVLQDREAFYKRKAKDFNDARLDMCATLNRQMYVEILRTYLKRFAGVIVFGAGGIGKGVGKWIRQQTGAKLVCFAVTSLEQNPQELYDVPIREAETLREYGKTHLIMLAIRQRDQYEAFKMLERMGFVHIVLIDKNFLGAVKSEM